MPVIWNENYIKQAEREYGQRVQSAGYFLVSRIRENISLPSRTVSFRDTKSGKRKKVLGARGSNRSKAGEYPHKDFGTFRQSIAQDFDGHLTTHVGSADPRALWFELGTKNMRPRKLLRATLAEERTKIVDIIAHGSPVNVTVGA